jgi:hypothetical protein
MDGEAQAQRLGQGGVGHLAIRALGIAVRERDQRRRIGRRDLAEAERGLARRAQRDGAGLRAAVQAFDDAERERRGARRLAQRGDQRLAPRRRGARVA